MAGGGVSHHQSQMDRLALLQAQQLQQQQAAGSAAGSPSPAMPQSGSEKKSRKRKDKSAHQGSHLGPPPPPGTFHPALSALEQVEQQFHHVIEGAFAKDLANTITPRHLAARRYKFKHELIDEVLGTFALRASIVYSSAARCRWSSSADPVTILPVAIVDKPKEYSIHRAKKIYTVDELEAQLVRLHVAF